MLSHLIRRQKPLAHVLAGVLLGLWLLAAFVPCGVTAGGCDIHTEKPSHHDGSAMKNPEICAASAALNCALPDPNPPMVDLAKIVMSTAVLYVAQPIYALPPIQIRGPRRARDLARIPSPPLNLKHAVLLI